MSTTTNLDKLKINYLTQEQYDNASENSQINENELYFTPGEDDADAMDEIAALVEDIVPTNVSEFNNDANYATATQVNAVKVLQINVPSFSSLPQTITDSKITSNHVVIGSVVSSPSAFISGTFNWTTSDGSITINGNINGSTGMTLYLAVKE